MNFCENSQVAGVLLLLAFAPVFLTDVSSVLEVTALPAFPAVAGVPVAAGVPVVVGFPSHPEVKTDPGDPAVTGVPVADALDVAGSPAIAGVPVLLVVWCSSQTRISNIFDSPNIQQYLGYRISNAEYLRFEDTIRNVDSGEYT